MKGLIEFSIKKRLEPEDSKMLFQSLQERLKNHIGKYIIVSEKDGRGRQVFLLEVLPNLLGRYRCFNDKGEFTGFLYRKIDLVLVYIGEHQLVFLD